MQSSLTAQMELTLPSPVLPFTLTVITLNCHLLVRICVPSWAGESLLGAAWISSTPRSPEATWGLACSEHIVAPRLGGWRGRVLPCGVAWRTRALQARLH